MRIMYLKPIISNSIRRLYSPTCLGLESFISTRNKFKNQFHVIEEKFKTKMNDFSQPDSTSIIFSEDLKQIIYLCDDKEFDLNLVRQMVFKFSKQNSNLRFGSFVFGPVLMRMYYALNKPHYALSLFNDFEADNFFDQIVSYQILMDLLFKNGMFNEVITIFDNFKRKQLHGYRYPKSVITLVFATCCKLNNAESYIYLTKLWFELKDRGNVPSRRICSFAAALALGQMDPCFALEVLAFAKDQNYITIRNLKVSALTDVNRADDALHIIQNSLDFKSTSSRKHTYCEEVISKLEEAMKKSKSAQLVNEFEITENQLRKEGMIEIKSLSDLLFSEIETVHMKSSSAPKPINDKKYMYNIRPGLQDML